LHFANVFASFDEEEYATEWNGTERNGSTLFYTNYSADILPVRSLAMWWCSLCDSLFNFPNCCL